MSQTGLVRMEQGEPLRRVLFLPDNPHDAETADEIFDEYEIQIDAVKTLGGLVEEAREGASCLLVAEEALKGPDLDVFMGFLQEQPEWSDLPVLIVTRKDPPSQGIWRLTEIANVAIIKRPLPIRTLVSLLKSALRDRKRQYEIRQSIANRDHFLAMVHHEIRNPLTAISLATQLLRGEDQQVIGIIKRQSESLERIINDLRDVSQVRSGSLRFERTRLDLVQLVRETIVAFAPIAAENNLKLTFQLPDRPLWVTGDCGRLSQVLGNIISNGIRYTPEGGRIEVKAQLRGDLAVVTITDTGVGIPKDKLDNIFELFSTAHEGKSIGKEGMGLGLHLASSIVEAHEGKLLAESAGEGQGATFSVWLPLVDPPVK